MSYANPKTFRRRSRLGKTAKREVQGYVQHQFNRYQVQQGKRSVGRMLASAMLSAAIGAMSTLVILRLTGVWVP